MPISSDTIDSWDEFYDPDEFTRDGFTTEEVDELEEDELDEDWYYVDGEWDE